jgi:hypothetical protein
MKEGSMEETTTRSSTSISISTETMELLNRLASEDLRNRSTEIAFLINEEWKRRQALKAITTPSARKPERN